MNCGFSERVLALYAENDLPEAEALRTERHLSECPACRAFVEEVRESQLVLKALRQETLRRTEPVSVRNSVLARVNHVAAWSPWNMRFERWLLRGYRRGFAMAAVAAAVLGAGVIWKLADVTVTLQQPAPVAAVESAPAPLQATPAPSVPAPPARAARPARRQTVTPGRVSMPEEPAVQAQSSPPDRAQSGQVVVKLLTDDPNIVIYWLLDGKEGGE
jgi:hypothetical protein